MGLTLMAFLLMMMIMWDRTEPGAYRVDGKTWNLVSLAFLIERVITSTTCAQFEMVKAIEIQCVKASLQCNEVRQMFTFQRPVGSLATDETKVSSKKYWSKSLPLADSRIVANAATATHNRPS